MAREIAVGDRLQFTARDKKLEVANRDLGAVIKVAPHSITVQMDGKGKRTVGFNPSMMRHFDHGYAVTSHSSQGLTAARVLVNINTETSRLLINPRLAYVAISRASEDARIYTNDASTLGQRLSTDVSKSAAVDFRPIAQIKEPAERVYTWAEHERHYAPLNKALSPAEAAQFGWKAETGTIQTYQHAETNRNIHIDGPTGQFYNQARNPISREAALDHSMPANYPHTQPASVLQNSVQPSVSQLQRATDQNRGYSL
jgi:hypothetical protein